MDHLHKHAYSYTSHIHCFSFFLFLCRVYVCGLIRMKVACACQKDGESLQCIVFTGSLVLTQQAQQQSQSQATQQRHDYVEYHGFGVSYSILRLSLTLSDDLRLNQKLNLQCKQPKSKIKSSFLFGEKQTLHFEARCWQACYQSCPFFFNLHQDNNKKIKTPETEKNYVWRATAISESYSHTSRLSLKKWIWWERSRGKRCVSADLLSVNAKMGFQKLQLHAGPRIKSVHAYVHNGYTYVKCVHTYHLLLFAFMKF